MQSGLRTTRSRAYTQKTARKIGLEYGCCRDDGLIRKRVGKGFRYLDGQGQPVKDPETLDRIRQLGIPPAWKNVWINQNPHAHLQATGVDSKNRKQYRYHPEWNTRRNEVKFERIPLFGESLHPLREAVDDHLKLSGLDKRKVIAAVIYILDDSLIRIENKEYARDNNSYGLTTLKDQHVEINGSTVQFEFIGKSGVAQQFSLHDRRIANIVKRCRDLPGYRLFQYLDENGAKQSVESKDVNDYLKTATNYDFTAKDFRTWGGSVHTMKKLIELGVPETKKEREKNVRAAVEHTAQQLGNTKAVCRKYYIHPKIIQEYITNQMVPTIYKRPERLARLQDEEYSLIRFLTD